MKLRHQIPRGQLKKIRPRTPKQVRCVQKFCIVGVRSVSKLQNKSGASKPPTLPHISQQTLVFYTTGGAETERGVRSEREREMVATLLVIVVSVAAGAVCVRVALLKWNEMLRYVVKKAQLPPGTMGCPLLGHTLQFLKDGPDFMKKQRAR